ncbi:flippase [Flavobacterium salilacus subsp. salilacus]|uniref:flippase n=1 Tax=Flavobacterium TaxID=237 RepID=UPI0010757B89|nr:MULTISPECIES: flippase [Flavobacterium]KAF2519127.1 flippase [Flavobacterium salilacus subsp. salilacus]MBE1613306.1 flippase [Flavobacterium sp. SaA2.13]
MIKKLLADKEALHYVLSKGGINFLFRMVAMLFSFIVMWFMTNYYGGTVWGNYSLALTVMQIAAMFFALGLPNAFISFSGAFTSAEQSKGLLVKSIKLVLLSSIVPVLLFSMGAGFIASYIFEKEYMYNYILIIALGVPCMMVHEIMCYYFMAVKKFILYGLSIFILPNVFLITALLFLYYNNIGDYFTFYAYIGAYLVTLIIGLVYIFGKRAKIIYPDITKRDIFRKSFPMMMSGIFLLLLNWTDMLMLGRYVTSEMIGIYNTAFKIGYLSLFFVVSMNAVILPKVSELYHQKNTVEMKKVVHRSTQLVILLTLPLAFGLIFFRDMILGVFDDHAGVGGVTLTLITLGGLYNAMTGNVDQILNMTNNHKSVSVIFFSGFVVNVILNLFLIPAYGIEGAAIASLVTNIYVNTVFVIIIRKKLGFYTFI